jgi:hypothetical protein
VEAKEEQSIPRAVVLSVAFCVVMTLALAGALYGNRSALPMRAAVFIAILIFGAIW